MLKRECCATYLMHSETHQNGGEMSSKSDLATHAYVQTHLEWDHLEGHYLTQRDWDSWMYGT